MIERLRWFDTVFTTEPKQRWCGTEPRRVFASVSRFVRDLVTSDLLDQPVVKDRRTNIVDVLKMAIERDPERRDLRMKLLETYYSAATTNQRGFLEIVRKLSREPNYLSADDWQKVVMMGRAIAPDDILFANQAKDDDLANCA